MEKATFGAGCFWGVQEAFDALQGVLTTTVGYMGGTVRNPTYEQVCTNTTGHVEVVQIEYDPSVISYEELLQVFWRVHDPTQVNRQGFDIGSQYRSVIFYHTDAQKTAAEQTKHHLQQARTDAKKIVTDILPAQEFYQAEDYHQHYNKKCRYTASNK